FDADDSCNGLLRLQQFDDLFVPIMKANSPPAKRNRRHRRAGHYTSLVPQVFTCGIQVINFIAQMVQARPALGQKTSHRRILARWNNELDCDVACRSNELDRDLLNRVCKTRCADIEPERQKHHVPGLKGSNDKANMVQPKLLA